MAEPAASFSCPACRKRFGWKPELVGKKVRCSGCNLKMRIPAAGGKAEALEPLPGGPAVAPASKPAKPAAPKRPPAAPPTPADDDAYEISLDDDLLGLGPSGETEPPQLGGGDASGGASGGKCPSCGQKVKPAAVICINCGFNLKAGKKIKTAVEIGGDDDAPTKVSAPAPGTPARGTPAPGSAPAGLNSERWQRMAAQVTSRHEADAPSDFKEKWAPPILIGVGLLLVLLDAFVLMYIDPDYLVAYYMTDDLMQARLRRILGAGISFALAMPFMFIGLVLVAKLFGSAYGGILTAVYKLAAIVALTTGVGQAFGSIMDRLTEGVGDFIGYLSIVVDLVAFWIGCAMTFDDMEPFEVMVLFLLVRLLPWIVGGFILAAVLTTFM